MFVRHSPLGIGPSTLSLKVGRRGEDGDALVHDALADPEVVIDPFLDAGLFRKVLRFYTGSVRSPRGERGNVSATVHRGELRGEIFEHRSMRDLFAR